MRSKTILTALLICYCVAKFEQSFRATEIREDRILDIQLFVGE